jgi:hypothetical protein
MACTFQYMIYKFSGHGGEKYKLAIFKKKLIISWGAYGSLRSYNFLTINKGRKAFSMHDDYKCFIKFGSRLLVMIIGMLL